MPHAAFAANFLWVLVLGLLGPSVPAIIADLGIGYAQMGLAFTLMSLGSLFGTSLGAAASDTLDRKTLYLSVASVFVLGLVSLSLVPSYGLILFCIFLLSLAGSPIGAIGQGIMLDLFPERRDRYLALMTLFSALGGLSAPLLVSLNFTLRLSWRWPFREAALLAALFCLALVFLRIPPARRGGGAERRPVLTVLRHPRVALSAVLIFFSVAADFGFSYWLAEFFRTELALSLRLSSAAVSIYLVGIIAGRFTVSRLVRRLRAERILVGAVLLALAALSAFLLLPVRVKPWLVFVYGLGIGPVFPLLMALGTRAWPDQPGLVTGILFGSLSLGGMVFPLLAGAVAARVGIARTYAMLGLALLGILITLRVRGRAVFHPAAEGGGG